MPKSEKGSKLCSEWGLNVRQFRYSEWGNWYGLIKTYPAALLDSNGYLYLESPADLNVSGILIGKRINVPKCISSLPGYVRIIQESNNISQNVTTIDVKYKDESIVTKSQWKDVLQNNEISHDLDIKTVLIVFNSQQSRSTATDIAEILGERDYHVISSGNISFSRRICKYLNIEPPKNSDGGNRWWTIPYWGSPTGDGKYFYILRPELKEAIEELISEGKLNFKDIVDSIPEIRIIPMSKTLEFNNQSIQVVQQDFFIKDLRDRENCLFRLRTGGINCDKNTLLLFQYDNRIIACAKLIEIIKYKKPYNGIYSEAMSLDRSSIQIFDPITSTELKALDPELKRFSQAKQTLNINCLTNLLNLIRSKKDFQIAEEIPEENADKLFEGVKRQITVNAYERNSKARAKCIEHYRKLNNGKTACQICGFDFGMFYGKEVEGKIHVHHLTPLYEIGEGYEVNAISDLIPICPNCHLVIHSKEPAYTPQEIKRMLRNKN